SPSLAAKKEVQNILGILADRAKGTNPAADPAAKLTYTINHYQGANAQGWQVAETSHFFIYHKQSKEYVEKVAKIAERTRYDMYRKWFGNAGPEWNPKCELYLHATGEDYSRATGVPASSPGHSRFENASGRVVGRRMELRCDNPTLLEAVLPHETTHVVLAGPVGGYDGARSADPGGGRPPRPPGIGQTRTQ